MSTLVAAQLEELVARIEQVERLQAAGATETARVSNEWRSKFEAVTSLEAQLQSIAEGVARAARRTESERPALDELDERLRAVEQAGIDAAAELARVSSAWAGELDRMAAKIDDSVVAASRSASRESEAEQLLAELGTRLDAIVHERQTVAAQIAKASENEVAELRNLIDGLRSRFAPVDQESAGSPSVEGHIDELARRPESMQIVDRDLESEPGPGEGRLRLELRALELRAERAEKAAQQSREAVLAQVDLLTDQVESRFQKLESETTEPSSAEVDGHEEEVGHAEVVPLRGGEV